jgi:hypothetical protein
MHDDQLRGCVVSVLVRDAEALGMRHWVSPATVATLKGPRADIINAINLGRLIDR